MTLHAVLYWQSDGALGAKKAEMGDVMQQLTWISVEISPNDLKGLNLVEGYTVERPTSIVLPPNSIVYCFQGKHRLAVATEWLDPSDLWWILYLYDSTKWT